MLVCLYAAGDSGSVSLLRIFDSTPKLGFTGLKFHSLRHTFASVLLKSGEDLKLVSEALGHANPAITLNIYQRILPGMKERVGAAIDRIFGTRNA